MFQCRLKRAGPSKHNPQELRRGKNCLLPADVGEAAVHARAGNFEHRSQLAQRVVVAIVCAKQFVHLLRAQGWFSSPLPWARGFNPVAFKIRAFSNIAFSPCREQNTLCWLPNSL